MRIQCRISLEGKKNVSTGKKQEKNPETTMIDDVNELQPNFKHSSFFAFFWIELSHGTNFGECSPFLFFLEEHMKYTGERGHDGWLQEKGKANSLYSEVSLQFCLKVSVLSRSRSNHIIPWQKLYKMLYISYFV